MKKINTAPISGTQELTPREQAKFDRLKTLISSSYHQHGFLNIETPTIERTEILLAKAGGETEKQIYRVVKTSSAESNDKESLRFDHTVPLARYVVEHENDLHFPFKVSQVGVNFRGERAQKGRFREFYQCDIDVIGRNSLPIAYDADVIATLLSTLLSFELNTPVLARVSNRKILSGLLEALDLVEKSKDIFNIIDHAEKVTPEQTKTSLEELGLEKDIVKKLTAFIDLNGERSEVIKSLGNLEISNETFSEGILELDQVLYLLESAGFKEQAIADMKIVRGLDYYTGTVFEFILPEYKNIGSICGGGRYENLTKYFTDKSFPGVGGSIGLTRLFYVLNECGLVADKTHLLDYAIVPVSENEFDEAMIVARKLRNKKYSTTIVFAGKNLGDKLTYATKVSKNGIVIGEAEINSETLKSKNFETGETSEININAEANPEDFWAD